MSPECQQCIELRKLYDAQAARLATVEAERDHLRDGLSDYAHTIANQEDLIAALEQRVARLAAVEAERDRQTALVEEWREMAADWRRLAERRSADYNTRLAALEAAARAWAAGPHQEPPPHCTECAGLYDAVRALAAPP